MSKGRVWKQQNLKQDAEQRDKTVNKIQQLVKLILDAEQRNMPLTQAMIEAFRLGCKHV